eukprot:g37700.t1
MRLVFLWQHNAPDGLTALACFSLDPYDGLRMVKSDFYDTVLDRTNDDPTKHCSRFETRAESRSTNPPRPMCSSMRVFATECERKYSTIVVMLSPEGEQELLNKALVTEINTFLTSGASSVEREWRRYTGSPGSMRVQAQAWLGEMLTATQETQKVIFEELQKLPAEYRGTTVVTNWLPHKIVDLGKCKSELNPMPREWCPCRTSQGAQVQCCPGCENLVITKDAEKGKRMHKRVVLFLRSQNSYRRRQANTHGPHFKVMPQNVKKFLSQHGWNVKTTWGWCRRRRFVQHPGHAVREDRQKVRILAPGIEAGGSLQKLIDNQQKQRNATVPLVPLDAATDEGDSQQGQKPGWTRARRTRERHELILFYACNEGIPEEASCDVLADGLTWLPMRCDASGPDINQTQYAVFIIAGHQLQTTCPGLDQIQEFTVDRNFSKGTKCTVLVGKVMIRPTRSKREVTALPAGFLAEEETLTVMHAVYPDDFNLSKPIFRTLPKESKKTLPKGTTRSQKATKAAEGHVVKQAREFSCGITYTFLTQH